MKQTLISKDIAWHDIAAPETEELAAFVRDSKLTPLDAEFVVQERHRPEVATRSEYILLLIQVPVFDRQARVTSGVALYCIVTSNSVWTLHYQPIPVLEKLFLEFTETPEKQEEYFGETPLSLALHILGNLTGSSFRKLERLSKHLDIAEDAVFTGNERKMVEEIALLSRDVIDFRKIMRPQQKLFAEVPSHDWVTNDIRVEWKRLHSQLLRLWDVLEGLLERVKELGKTNSSLLQHKENQMLRLLTIYSIVAIPLLLLTDPFFDPSASDASPYVRYMFWAIFIVFVGILVAILVRFKGKRVI